MLRVPFVAKHGLQCTIRPSRTFCTSMIPRIRHKGTYKSEDSTVETDEIISENNPWSPTLYNDIVRVREGWRNVALPENYRLLYEPLYEAPGSKYVAMLKRLTLSFAVIGVYGAKLFYELVQFDDVYALGTIIGTWAPAVAVQYKTRDYVTRVFRLYDKTKPQTLENLVNDEKLIMEKLSATGGKTYNTLLTISGNSTLKLCGDEQSTFAPYQSWEAHGENGKQYYYVVDNVGGMKMDRLWGIVEHNLGVDNGRYIAEAAVETK
ncbi:CIC11C00000000115 [Sungouiella intermedia]|uniref:CIC11C00000000115 n=1 Tax=Sungouiella intermedia TaxID=45354 RepID=A0A1L0BTN0_9ASCO|nr:CIC11C00000006043 [[Candida] intermedia]SGZ54697.1 CIC11C00000000115 [[Candida] intermedia]